MINFNLPLKCFREDFDAEYKCDCIFSPEKENVTVFVKYTEWSLQIYSLHACQPPSPHHKWQLSFQKNEYIFYRLIQIIQKLNTHNADGFH